MWKPRSGEAAVAMGTVVPHKWKFRKCNGLLASELHSNVRLSKCHWCIQSDSRDQNDPRDLRGRACRKYKQRFRAPPLRDRARVSASWGLAALAPRGGLRQMLTVQPALPAAHLMLAEISEQMGRPDLALDHYWDLLSMFADPTRVPDATAQDLNEAVALAEVLAQQDPERFGPLTVQLRARSETMLE